MKKAEKAEKLDEAEVHVGTPADKEIGHHYQTKPRNQRIPHKSFEESSDKIPEANVESAKESDNQAECSGTDKKIMDELFAECEKLDLNLSEDETEMDELMKKYKNEIDELLDLAKDIPTEVTLEQKDILEQETPSSETREKFSGMPFYFEYPLRSLEMDPEETPPSKSEEVNHAACNNILAKCELCRKAYEIYKSTL
ncbi:hypothetical protein C0J52_25926 [Blattella germanica]|nr:hypothetical protein C0J52_25926 [Blattella germanica]